MKANDIRNIAFNYDKMNLSIIPILNNGIESIISIIKHFGEEINY